MKKKILIASDLIRLLENSTDTERVVRKYILTNILNKTNEIIGMVVGVDGRATSPLAGHNSVVGVSVIGNETLVFSKGTTVNPDGFIRFAFFTADDTLIVRPSTDNVSSTTVPATAVTMNVSYPSDSNLKVQRFI